MGLDEVYVESMAKSKEGRSFLMQEIKEVDAILAQEAKEKGEKPKTVLEICLGARLVPAKRAEPIP